MRNFRRLAPLLAIAASVLIALLASADELDPMSYSEEMLQQREKLQEVLTSLRDLPAGDEALQLIRPMPGHDRLEVNELVLEKLAAINEPVSIVSIVGPYHSGKSFLLNVLMGSSYGFPVGAKPDPETRGVWIRILPKDKARGADGSQVILLDTEGFYGEGVSRIYDARIFAVATLISSHLIYNTLRTLGDTQSVSALADLSKQAQVFNLQNWLHTAHATTDSSSLDVDPFLLLETLNFPPLTWVIQGFDMDIEPSSSPLKYLQKFIAAHSQAGDRTLDTLFSQGINCFTLRTPADLNAIREQVGGEGLAADAELIDFLHPRYLSDLKALRDGVFSGLRAKGDGNFTGKSLGSLLPLLVHYVNEDFPLNADRKLKDVLADIIVDGAFSGGVQYFQLSMEAFSKPAGEKLRKKQESLDAPGALATLAASALTSAELERVLTSAEKKAIDYCKRRCVGVPQGLVGATCEAQLAVKITRMKPQYREENDRKVKEVLVRLGEGLRESAIKKIEGLELPMRESDIQSECTRAIQNVSKSYDTLVGPHRGSQLYNEAKSQMQEDIQVKCDRVIRSNVEKISGILNTGKEAYRQAYEASVRAGGFAGFIINSEETGLKPLSAKKISELNIAAVKAGQAAFSNTVKTGSLSWIGPGYEPYDFHNFQCLQWSKQRFSEIQAQNELHVKSFCESLAGELTKRYKEEMNQFSPFPDNDETITGKADALGKEVMKEYLSSVQEFSSIPVVEEKRRELFHSIEESRSHLLNKNTHLMAAFCYDPLMDAFKELRMEECDTRNMFKSTSFWTPKCLWPGPRYMFGFKYRAFSVARKHLDMAEASKQNSGEGKGVVLSSGTRNKVIHSWIEQTLSPHSNTVLFNFGILSSFGIGLLGCAYFLIKIGFGGGERRKGAGMSGVQWNAYSPSSRHFKGASSPNINYRQY